MTLRPRAILFLVAAILCAAPVSVRAQAPRAYHVEDLGSLGGLHLIGSAVNIHGEVAGFAYLPDGTIHAFRWSRSGGLEDLGANGGTGSQAMGINDRGDVVGWYLSPEWAGTNGFIAPRGGTMQNLRSIERNIVQVNSITNDGQMTGMMEHWGEFSGLHAFRTRKDGTLQDIGYVGTSMGLDINNAGDVVGFEYRGFLYAFKFSDTITECRWIPCGKMNLGTFGGNSTAMSINNAGVVVGWSERLTETERLRAFRAHPDMPLEDLGTLGGETAGAEAINDAGAIVGWSAGQYPMTAFLYTDADGMIDLNTRIPASEGSRMLQRAVAINEVGQIVVLYEGERGTATVLLTPMVDTEPPVITAVSASPSVLQPPNGRMIPVTVAVSATDNMDPSPVCAIATVANNEATSDNNTDIEVTGALTASLRAFRFGAGDGRTYTIRIRCADDAGNASTADVAVLVPHDQRP